MRHQAAAPTLRNRTTVDQQYVAVQIAYIPPPPHPYPPLPGMVKVDFLLTELALSWRCSWVCSAERGPFVVQCCGGMGRIRGSSHVKCLPIKQYSCDCANRWARVLLQCVLMAIIEPLSCISPVFSDNSSVCFDSHSGVNVNRASSLFIFSLFLGGFCGVQLNNNRLNASALAFSFFLLVVLLGRKVWTFDNHRRILDSLYGKPCLCFKVFIFNNVTFWPFIVNLFVGREGEILYHSPIRFQRHLIQKHFM